MKPTLDEFYASLRYDEETDKFVSPTGEVFDGLQQARNAFHRDGMTVDRRLVLTITKEAQTGSQPT